MTESAAEPPLSALRSHGDVTAATHWALDHALSAQSRQLTWLDPDFSVWPLGDVAVLDRLTRWLQLPQRRLVLVAQGYNQVERQHPRFVAWRRDRAHAVQAWSPSADNEVRLPSLLVDDRSLCLQVFDATQWRGRLGLDERAVRQWHDEIDALLQRSEAAFPVRPLGL